MSEYVNVEWSARTIAVGEFMADICPTLVDVRDPATGRRYVVRAVYGLTLEAATELAHINGEILKAQIAEARSMDVDTLKAELEQARAECADLETKLAKTHDQLARAFAECAALREILRRVDGYFSGLITPGKGFEVYDTTHQRVLEGIAASHVGREYAERVQRLVEAAREAYDFGPNAYGEALAAALKEWDHD